MMRSICLRSFVTFCLVLLLPVAAHAGPAKEGGDDLSFLEGLTLVVLEDGDVPSLHAAKDLIHSYGGHVAVMSPPSLLLGWVPFESRGALIGRAGIKDIFYTDVLPGEVGVKDGPSQAVVSYFNAAVRGEILDEHLKRLEASGSTDQMGKRPDKLIPPEFEMGPYLDNLRAAGLDLQSLQDRGILPETVSQGALGNSDYMTGTIALSLFFVESDGSGTDPNQYTWTAEDMQKYLNGVITGLAWWAGRAPLYGGCSATFLIYHYSGADPRCQQWMEPVLHSSSYESDWVNAIMANFGYSLGNMWQNVTAFNTWQRSTYQTNRAYSAFIVYNPPPAPTSFPDGATAYAWYMGPHTVLLFNLTGSTIAQVFAHETGHIFGACDEYAGGCSHCGTCRNGVDNGNCEVCSAHPTTCVMLANDLIMCSFTPGHVGWDGASADCDPAPPPPLPSPAVAVSYPASLYHGQDGSLTVGGANFYAGAWVDLGPEVFIHKTTLVGAESLKVDVTVFPDAAPGYYDVTVRNRDFQEATLPGALQILPTTRHYYSPTGGNNYPYLFPADAATSLQAAINAGYSGDTLFVPTMTFPNFTLALSTGVLLHGGWNSTFTARDLETGKTVLQMQGSFSILDGAQYGGLDGFILENSQNSAVRVFYEDFTIANCEFRFNAGSNGLTDGTGGAICAEEAAVDIRDNYFHDNTATWGGAIYLRDCSGLISGNTISGNTVSAIVSQPYGGGMYLVDCADVSINGNVVEGNTGAQTGGGLYLDNSTNVTMSGGSFANNTATFQGGGVIASHSEVDVTGVDFDHNSAPVGGGFAATDTSAVGVNGCRFLWNSGAVGGGLYASPGQADVKHNLFVGNAATGGAGAMFLGSLSSGVVTGNTLDRNSSTAGAGGMAISSCGVEVFNNIVTNSTGYGVAVSGSPAPVESYNLVWNSSAGDHNGYTPGTGSISSDPLYVDTTATDYHVGVHSPVIDAGRPGALYQDPDGSAGDMGWYGSHAFVMDQPGYPKNLDAEVVSGDVILSWDGNPEGDLDKYAVYASQMGGFKPSASNFLTFVTAPDTTVNLGEVSDTTYYVISVVDTDAYASGYSGEATYDPATGTLKTAVTYKNRLYQNVPNPFNPSTLVRYELRDRAHVSLVVYDVAGRQVRRLVDAGESAGVHKVEWDGTNDQGLRVSSGIYFYRLKAGAFLQTRKMVLLK